MKRILLALTMVGFLLPFAPPARAETGVSLNFFYDNLSPYGNWIEVGDYGYCFQPNVEESSPDWRPYADGYWAYTDVGWTWVSYEDFGWATYHYGRWTNLADYGWVWVPGDEWGPAWVSWRSGGDYVGWAPLPPDSDVYEGRAITGQVDVQFDIGPLYYNFVDVRYIGEPVLRSRIFPSARNVTFINQTVNITNITYNNSTVYNYGPDYNRLNQYSTRPIQRLSLQRETTVGANLGQGGRPGNLNRVNGNQLMVVAPPIQKSQQPIAPRQVKAKVAQPKVEHGWQGIANRQQLQEEMKKENAQNVPPPTFQPERGRKAQAGARGQNPAVQPNEVTPANERNQPAEKEARPGSKNGGRPHGGAPIGQTNENGNLNTPANRTEQQAEQNAAREERARTVEQQKAQRQQALQQRRVQQENRAQQQNTATPVPSPVKKPERSGQNLRPQQTVPARPTQRPARLQPPPPNRPPQPPNRPQRVQPSRPPQGEQNPNAPRKPKKKDRQDQSATPPPQ